jgi:hypothetical protein
MTKLQSKQFPRTLFLIIALAALFLAQTVTLAQTDSGRIVGLQRVRQYSLSLCMSDCFSLQASMPS